MPVCSVCISSERFLNCILNCLLVHCQYNKVQSGLYFFCISHWIQVLFCCSCSCHCYLAATACAGCYSCLCSVIPTVRSLMCIYSVYYCQDFYYCFIQRCHLTSNHIQVLTGMWSWLCFIRLECIKCLSSFIWFSSTSKFLFNPVKLAVFWSSADNSDCWCHVLPSQVPCCMKEFQWRRVSHNMPLGFLL